MKEAISNRIREASRSLACREPIPDNVLVDNKYTLRFAKSLQDLDNALRLRFEVFNLELAEGLDTSYATQRDRDGYDDQCHHLLVIDNETREAIGTYRMQTVEMAEEGIGFYSASEYHLAELPAKVLSAAVEVGRACIAKQHRNGRVLFLLWKGLAQYMVVTGKRYLFGCCSLTSQDPLEAGRVMDALRHRGQVHEQILISPLPGFECYPQGAHLPVDESIQLPRLFRTYLAYGAKVCGWPAIDRQFKTIDYLVLLDIARLDANTRKIFF